MNVADYLAEALAQQGVTHVFGLPGGQAMHLMDAVVRHPQLTYVSALHEQAASFMAVGYARETGHLAACLVTTGPGGTNAITGLAGAWLDSLPIVFISGQFRVTTLEQSRSVRQSVLQQMFPVELVRPLTKYAEELLDPLTAKLQIDAAILAASCGRMGPVWLDIPLDIQASEVDLLVPPIRKLPADKPMGGKVDWFTVEALLKKSLRPVVLAGRGVVLSGAAEELIDFCERHSLPILTSIGGIDLIGDDHPLFFGRPNYWGQREANFIIQNADLILSIGAGLHFETTGFQSELFARHATIISVDIDLNELNKPSPRIDEKILCDAGFFLRSAVGLEVIKPKEAWLRYCAQVRERFKFDQFPDPEKSTRVPLYEAIELISNTLDSDTTIVYGNAGSHFTTSVQCFRVKFGQTLISCVGIGAMGASIPIAIGSAFASPKRRVVVFTGDGGFQFNMQELANIVGYGLPIHLFVFENGGYASLRGTQKRYFNGRLICSSPESNLFLPNIAEVASAFGIKVNEINERHELNEGIRWNLAQPMALTVLHIDLETPIQPKLGSSLKNDGDMISDPLEDLSPHLSNDEFHRWMLIPSLRTGQKLSES